LPTPSISSNTSFCWYSLLRVGNMERLHNMYDENQHSHWYSDKMVDLPHFWGCFKLFLWICCTIPFFQACI
jgi:hypothetical protein